MFTPQAVREGRAAMVSHYNSDQKLRLVLNLQPPHQADEDAFIKDLVTKGSPGFHKFLSQEEWNARFAPSVEDEQAVVDWAQSVGLTVTKRYPNRLLVSVEGTAATIETAFGVTINNYQVGDEIDFSNDRNPVIPSRLTGILSAVAGLNNIERVHRMGTSHATVKAADYVAGPAISELGSAQGKGDPTKAPATVAAARNAASARSVHAATADMPKASSALGAHDSYPLDYKGGTYAMDPANVQSSEGYDFNGLQRFSSCCNEPASSAGSPPESSIALVGFGGFNLSDVETFFGAYGMAYNLTWYCIDGSTCPSNDGEAPLDVEYSGAMSNSYGSYLDTAHIYEYEMVDNKWSTYEEAYNDVLSDGHAKVVSTSYGGNEDINSTDAGIETGTVHSIFNNMVAAGITLIAASGDNGAADGCGAETAVDFPGSDPDFIAAGGTQLNMNTSGIFSSETAWQGEFWTNADNNGHGGACANNHGGSTGGRSVLFGAPSWQTMTGGNYPTGVESPFYSWQTVNGVTTEYINTGFTSRLVPDISLTANPDVLGEWYYSSGSWQDEGGTSIVAPELAGFFAQENSYLDTLGYVCGSGSSPCSPVGLASPFIYDAGVYGAPHNPLYDMTSGCNNNDITVAYNLFYYCAYTGYDPITGWGSANMMQLAWAINWQLIPAVGNPSITFGGPAINTWFNTDHIVDWDLNDAGSGSFPAPGALGFTLGWDTIPSDPQSQPHGGDGNSFYAGPQYLSTFGCVDNDGSLCEAASGQGCHTVYVEGWDNQGRTTTGSYGPVCFDSVAPVSNATLSGTVNGSVYTSAVKVTITSTDATSGVAHTYYSLDGGGYVTYGGAFTVPVSALGSHTVLYYSTDNATNSSTVKSISFTISSPTTTMIASSTNPSTYGQSVTITATVTPSLGGTAIGTVTFYHGTTILGTAALAANVAKLTLDFGVGPTTITATYGGSTNDLSSTSSPLVQNQNKATTATTLASSANPSSYNQSVTITAKVAPAFGGTATGTVTFYHGTTVLATETLTGNVAKYTTSTYGVGTTTIHAVYAGDKNCLTSTSGNLVQTANQASTTTTLSSSLNPSNYGQSVTITAKVNPAFGGNATGTVTFYHGSIVLATETLTGNVATYTASTYGVGTTTIHAVYVGDKNYLTSTSGDLVQTADKASTTTTLTSSKNPSTHGTSVTFTATVHASSGATPTGSVIFKDGSTTLGTGTVNGSGVASFSTAALAVGTHSITAAYGGSSDDATSTSSDLSQKVE